MTSTSLPAWFERSRCEWLKAARDLRAAVRRRQMLLISRAAPGHSRSMLVRSTSHFGRQPETDLLSVGMLDSRIYNQSVSMKPKPKVVWRWL